jgi:uncharacterized protein with gpF-like domain
MDKRDKRINLKYAYIEALKHNEELRKTYPDSKGYIWRTQRDDKVRALHEILEGQYCEWDDPPVIGIDKGGIEIHGHPGEAWNCRCWAETIEEPVPSQSPIKQQPIRHIESIEEAIRDWEKNQKITIKSTVPETRIPITKTKKYKEQINTYARMIAKAGKKLYNLPKTIISSIIWSKRK